MTGYMVVKSHLNFGNIVYSKGDIIELSDKDGTKLWKVDGCVIPVAEDRLPTEADGLFKVLQDKIAGLEQELANVKAENLRLTNEVILKANELETTKLKKK